PHVIVDPDAARARIEADRVIGRREDDALDPFAPRRLEQVVAADDVGAEDRLPRAFDRMPAEMDDAVDPVDHSFHRRRIGEVGGVRLDAPRAADSACGCSTDGCAWRRAPCAPTWRGSPSGLPGAPSGWCAGRRAARPRRSRPGWSGAG